MWFWVRLYGANELQKGCFDSDVLLFGCLWVACGFGCVCMGQMGLQKGCFEVDVLLFGCLWCRVVLVHLHGATELQKGNLSPACYKLAITRPQADSDIII